MSRQEWFGTRPDRVTPQIVPTDRYVRRIRAARKKLGLIGGGYPTRSGPPKALALAA
jgi:hypothetical protein